MCLTLLLNFAIKFFYRYQIHRDITPTILPYSFGIGFPDACQGVLDEERINEYIACVCTFI